MTPIERAALKAELHAEIMEDVKVRVLRIIAARDARLFALECVTAFDVLPLNASVGDLREVEWFVAAHRRDFRSRILGELQDLAKTADDVLLVRIARVVRVLTAAESVVDDQPPLTLVRKPEDP